MYLVMWKHVCGNENVRIWWIGYTYMVMWKVYAVKWMYEFENEKNIDSVIRMPDLVMQICVIGNVRIRARWICPYAWRSVRTPFRGGRGELAEYSQPISWWTWGNWGVFALYFVGGKETFTKCSQRVRNLFDYIRKIFATGWLSEC